MATPQEKAQELCTKTEWDTISNSFPPRMGELSSAVLKKAANRVRRFIEKEKTEPGESGRLAVFEEALKRLEEGRASADEGEGETAKLAARREKEKAARDRQKSVNDRRKEVKTKLKEKADKEKAEKEGEPKEDGKENKSGPQGVRKHLQAAAKPGAKSGFRKV